MYQNVSQEKLELLIRVAESRVTVIDGVQDVSQQLQRQKQHVVSVRNKLLSTPVLICAGGLVGTWLLTRLFKGKKHKEKAIPTSVQVAGIAATYPIWRMLAEVALGFLFPMLKKKGLAILSDKVVGLFKRK